MAAIASQLRPRLMLAGVRIVSFGQLISAPLAAALFRACGAEVVAVAHPRRLDSVVYGPMPQPLDLASRDGRREAARLCRRADLVVDNVRPRVWTNLGLVPSELSGVHLSLPAFPWRDTLRRNFKAYGFQMEALFGAGLQPVRTVGGPVTAPRSALLDHSVGLSAFVAGAGTLLSGRVGRVELSHVDVLAAAGVGAS
jgi:crotonobetainyl-CoA:carnitine CoA-transferase CaiB-like acyl-CoA transferase